MKLLLLVAAIACIAPQTFAGALTDFSWLAGCWENSANGYEEQWMKPAGDIMLGMSRTTRNGKVVEYEFVLLQEKESSVFYVARPSEQQKAEFKMTSYENNQAVFENPAHDFPQKIVYRLNADQSLTAWIEGTIKGKPRKSEFPMTRAQCAN